jgi:hypothetical protein
MQIRSVRHRCSNCSHWSERSLEGKAFYLLSPADLAKLQEAGVHEASIPARAGDVLFMRGGDVVHGSPAGGDQPRYMTYARFGVSLPDPV